jgi:N-methylhydantoinase A
VYFAEAGGFISVPLYTRTRLLAGNRITGPALVEEHASTTVLAPGDVLTVDRFANLDITIGGRRNDDGKASS